MKKNERRDAQKDLSYLYHAEMHAGEGFALANDSIKLIIDMAIFWALKASWRPMNDPDLEYVKVQGTRILVFVPWKILPSSNISRIKLPPRALFVHWSRAIEATKALTPSKHSVELTQMHDGFWATDRRGIKPLKGAPTLWMPQPETPQEVK